MGSCPSSQQGSLDTIKKALPVPFHNNNILDSVDVISERDGKNIEELDSNGSSKDPYTNQESARMKQSEETYLLEVNQDVHRKSNSSSPLANVIEHIPKSPKLSRKKPPRLIQASYRPCYLLQIKVLRGHNVTLGSFDDFFDTPDPYVSLHISTSPHGYRRTKVKSNNVNPIWDEVFYFYLDPTLTNLLDITLKDSDTLVDDLVETKTFDLGTLELNKTQAKTFTFREVSKVDVEMKVEICTSPTDMRYSTELCREEKNFLTKRKEFVFDAMKSLLGERGPQTVEEAPTVAILGSGGGFRAMVSLSGVYCALKDMGVLDCAMYAAGLSGSAWYLSTLYSHPDWPNVHPRVVRDKLRDNVDDNWVWMMLTPSWTYRHLKIIMEKKRRGQPVSFTDFFGYLVGETILKDREDNPILSEQQEKVQDALVPFPLYSCVHVKKDVSAKEYCEWMEFSPFEIGMPKYGTFMRTEHFGSKFFCGKLVASYPEPPLYYLQGLWGSAFTILLQRVLKEGKTPDETIKEMRNTGDLREELEEMVCGKDDDDDEVDGEDSDSDNEDDTDDEETNENNDENSGFFEHVFESLLDKLKLLKTRVGRAGLVHNFLRGLEVLSAPVASEKMEDVAEAADQLALTAKHIYLVDSGLVFNSPYPPILRPERSVDVILSFDFSARDREIEFPFKELLLAEEWAKKNNLKFPPIKAELQYKKYGLKEFYVFRHQKDPTCPVVIHFALVNKTFKEQITPGVRRTTKEEKDFANFSIFENRHDWYSTFNFHYHAEPFNRLADLNEFNTLLAEQTIKDIIADCVKNRRSLLQASVPNDEQATNISGLNVTEKEEMRNTDLM